MNEIKIFIASSEELKHERQVFSDLALKLNLLLKDKEIKICLEKWEYLDSSMSTLLKQQEYNIVLKKCDLCIALFWTKFGDFTGEEFKVAQDEVLKKKTLKEALLYFKTDFTNKELNEEQEENMHKLTEFKQECIKNNVLSSDFLNDIDLAYLFITLINSYCQTHLGFDIAHINKEDNTLMVEHKAFVNLSEVTQGLIK